MTIKNEIATPYLNKSYAINHFAHRLTTESQLTL